MNDLRTAAQQALEALEHDNPAGRTATITALRAALAEDAMQKFTDVNQELEAALAEPVQEPVAWMHVPHPDNGLRPVVSLSQQRESSLYGASVPLFIKEQL